MARSQRWVAVGPRTPPTLARRALPLGLALAAAVSGLWAALPTANAASPEGGAYTALAPTRLLYTRVAGESSALGPGGSLSLAVVGSFGGVSVPLTATAVALNVTVTDTTASSYLTVFPGGAPQPTASNLNWAAGGTVSNLVLVEVGSGGEVSFYNQLGGTDLVVDLEGYFAAEAPGSTAGSYVALPPARITDTRAGSGQANAGDTLSSGGVLPVQVTGMGGVPASGVSAAVLNVTVTDTSTPSFLTVYPGGSPPTASNLNWYPGETVAHRVMVPVSSTGQISIYNDQGSTDVVVDVNGYFTDGSSAPAAASLFTPLAPVRVLDTRQALGPLGPGSSLNQGMAALDGIPAAASAVAANVTVTDTTGPSYLSVYPSARSGTSDLNWLSGQTTANLALTTLNDNGTLSIYNQQGATDLVIDAFGYFIPLNPQVEIVTSLAPLADIGLPYAGSLLGASASAPYSFGLVGGTLPPGVSLASSGVLTGTPSQVGSFSYTVRMTDSSSPVATVTDALTLTVVLAPNAVLPGQAGSAPIISGATTSGGTPILDARPGTRLYLTVGFGGALSWSSSEPPSAYPGATAISDALAFPQAEDHVTIESIINECDPYWGLPDSQMQQCENLPDYRGECSFWAVMNWGGSDPTVITANGNGIAARAIAESVLTGASYSVVPAVGELVSWQPGGPYFPPFGHAAVVVGVNPSNFSYVVEEMNYGTNRNSDWDIDVRVVSDNAAQPPSFAAPPS